MGLPLTSAIENRSVSQVLYRTRALLGTYSLISARPTNVQSTQRLLKALCHYIRHNCVLMNSLLQEFNQKLVQEVTARVV